MPRARSYNWRTDPKYRMREGHENKMMRPSTHKLLDKLRNMKMLQEPGMVNVVIYDLAHHFLYKNKEEVLLGDIAGKLQHMWVGLVQNEEGKPAYIYGQPENHPQDPVTTIQIATRDGATEEEKAAGRAALDAIEITEGMTGILVQEPPVRHFLDGKLPSERIAADRLTNWVRHYENLRGLSEEVHRASGIPNEDPGELHLEDIKALLHFVNHVGYEVAAPVAGSVADSAGDSPFEDQLKEFLKKERKNSEDIIWNHAIRERKGMSIICECGRTYMADEEWARHLRIRIERLLTNFGMEDTNGSDS